MIKDSIKTVMFNGFQKHTFQSTPTSPRCNYASQFIVYAGMLNWMKNHWGVLLKND